MSIVSHRILLPFNFCNKVIQASNASLDMKVANTESLLTQLVALRDSWKAIWNEAKLVESSLQIEVVATNDAPSSESLQEGEQ